MLHYLCKCFRVLCGGKSIEKRLKPLLLCARRNGSWLGSRKGARAKYVAIGREG